MSPTDPRPSLTLALADDPDEFGGEELENALSDPESLADPRGRRAGKNMGRLISQAGTNVKIEIPPQVLAADLVVNLPQRGLRVRSPDLWVSGKTNIKNKLTGDGCHMNKLGNIMMAKGVLRAFGLSETKITEAEARWTTK